MTNNNNPSSSQLLGRTWIYLYQEKHHFFTPRSMTETCQLPFSYLSVWVKFDSQNSEYIFKPNIFVLKFGGMVSLRTAYSVMFSYVQIHHL